MHFGPITLISCLKLVITGSRDEIAPVNMITKMLPTWNPEAQLEVINGADHFYDGYIKALESILSAYP